MHFSNLSNFSSLVINCFRKAYFNFEKTNEIEMVSEENESDIWEQLKSTEALDYESFEEYVAIDDIECTEEEIHLTDEELIQKVYSNDSESDSIIESEESPETQKITDSQALRHLSELQTYLWQNSNNNFDTSFAEIQKFITNNTFHSFKQTKIDDYFKP